MAKYTTAGEILQEVLRIADETMDYIVTETQKSTLEEFGLANKNIRKQAEGITEDLKSCNTKEAYQWHAENLALMTPEIKTQKPSSVNF